jgi:hypothetical protein
MKRARVLSFGIALMSFAAFSATTFTIFRGMSVRNRPESRNDSERSFSILFASLRSYDDFGSAIEATPNLPPLVGRGSRVVRARPPSSMPTAIKSKGTGIGLAICRRFLQSVGGSIALEDRVHGGTRACFNHPETCTRECLSSTRRRSMKKEHPRNPRIAER